MLHKNPPMLKCSDRSPPSASKAPNAGKTHTREHIFLSASGGGPCRVGSVETAQRAQALRSWPTTHAEGSSAKDMPWLWMDLAGALSDGRSHWMTSHPSLWMGKGWVSLFPVRDGLRRL